MKTLLLAAIGVAALFAAAPATAAPVPVTMIVAPATGATEVAYMRRRAAMRPYMYRRPAYRRPVYRRPMAARRMYAPSQTGNARNPNAPVNQQQQGQTTGGPRY